MEATKLHHYAQCSQLAYLDKGGSKFKKLGYTVSKFIEHEGAQAYIVSNKDQITVCFRGTEPSEISDLAADAKAWYSNGFHAGFKTEADKLINKIQIELKTLLKKKSRPVTITGHSLGGGMSVVASYYLASKPQDPGPNFNVKHVITFGGPRATSLSKSYKCPVPVIRVVNNNDVVTKVPFWLLGYKHVGELFYLNYFGNVRKMTKWQRIKDSWRGRWRAFKKGVPFDGLYDHSMNEYIKYLSNAKD
jgi:predicted lipase